MSQTKILVFVFILLLAFNNNVLTGWERTYEGSAWDEGYSIAQKTDGKYIVMGYTMSFGVGGDDIYLVIGDDSLVVKNRQIEKPDNPNLHIFSNPFNSSVTITVGMDSNLIYSADRFGLI